MPIEILMPALSPTMTEGKLAKWLKTEGDEVRSGDVIAEIETDKATMEVEAVDEGKLGKILVPAGTEGVPVNTAIALLLEEGEDAAALSAAPKKVATLPSIAPSHSQAPAAVPSVPAVAPPSGSRIFASPLAKRLAAQAKLDLTRLRGSGPHGRIIKADVDAAITARSAAPPPAAAPKAAPAAPAAPAAAGLALAGQPPFVEVANTTMRKVIARRLTQSKQEIPHFYLTIDCNLDVLLDLREKLNSRSTDGGDEFRLSVNDFIVRAVALAMRACPDVNASWTDEAIRLYQSIDVAVAVATPNGLITPVVRNADAKGLAAISNEVRQLAGRAREAKLLPEEYQGGGFTVSNLGMFGVREFAAIINPPQACLLAVGAAEKRPIVKDGVLAVATMMCCTLSVDHRVVDGAKGAEFLQVLKRLIEDPLSMLL
jgi:pyruvate dehydrogenase E2 component (dihydrolipoamide acetyltransferase)